MIFIFWIIKFLLIYLLLFYFQNPSYQYEEDPSSFSDLGIRKNLCTGLQELGFELPTEVQVNAYGSAGLKGHNEYRNGVNILFHNTGRPGIYLTLTFL